MPEEFPLSGGWLTDRIVEYSQESDFRRHAETAAFRLNADTPYLRLHFVSVYVSDQEQSLRFFVDKLGFAVVADVRFASGSRWVEVSPPDGTAVLALVLPMKGFHEEHLVGNSGLVTFLTEDVERTYGEWSSRGVHFPIPPQTPAWGGTFCRFVDPDGNSFALAGFTEVTRSIDERRRAYAEKVENERRVAQELEIAMQVQARLFPQSLPSVPGLDYAGSCVQARSVGGDYYDFLEFGAGRTALIVGDIAGKGIAAAAHGQPPGQPAQSIRGRRSSRPAACIGESTSLREHGSQCLRHAVLRRIRCGYRQDCVRQLWPRSGNDPARLGRC